MSTVKTTNEEKKHEQPAQSAAFVKFMFGAWREKRTQCKELEQKNFELGAEANNLRNEIRMIIFNTRYERKQGQKLSEEKEKRLNELRQKEFELVELWHYHQEITESNKLNEYNLAQILVQEKYVTDLRANWLHALDEYKAWAAEIQGKIKALELKHYKEVQINHQLTQDLFQLKMNSEELNAKLERLRFQETYKQMLETDLLMLQIEEAELRAKQLKYVEEEDENDPNGGKKSNRIMATSSSLFKSKMSEYARKLNFKNYDIGILFIDVLLLLYCKFTPKNWYHA